jgi:hypothetical protein
VSKEAELRREVRQLRRLIVRLARVLHTHMRTDIAPDAGLPAMRKLLDEIGRSTTKAGL